MQAVNIENKAIQTPEKNAQITIYVRNYAKRAIMLTINRKIKIEDVRKKIQDRMKVPIHQQILFCGGRTIDFSVSGEEAIVLGDRQIVHIVDQRRLRVPQLKISVKKIQPESQLFTFTIPSSTKVEKFLQEILSPRLSDISHYFLVYTGRQLNPEKTFQSQYIEDGSQILCVHRQKNLKSKVIPSNSQKQMKKENFENLKTAQKQNSSESSSQNAQEEQRENFNSDLDGRVFQKNRKNSEKVGQQEVHKFAEPMDENDSVNRTVSSCSSNNFNDGETKEKLSDAGQQNSSENEEKIAQNIPQKSAKSEEYLTIISQRTIYTEPKVYLCKQNTQVEETAIVQLEKTLKKQKKQVVYNLFDPHGESSDEEEQEQISVKMQIKNQSFNYSTDKNSFKNTLHY